MYTIEAAIKEARKHVTLDEEINLKRNFRRKLMMQPNSGTLSYTARTLLSMVAKGATEDELRKVSLLVLAMKHEDKYEIDLYDVKKYYDIDDVLYKYKI